MEIDPNEEKSKAGCDQNGSARPHELMPSNNLVKIACTIRRKSKRVANSYSNCAASSLSPQFLLISLEALVKFECNNIILVAVSKAVLWEKTILGCTTCARPFGAPAN